MAKMAASKTYYVHAVADTFTGEIVRYIIAPADRVGLPPGEAVSSREPLAILFGGLPVIVLPDLQTVRPFRSSVRIKIEGWDRQDVARELFDSV